MWERVKRLETEDLVTNDFVAWIIVNTRGIDTANTFDGIACWVQPSCITQYFADIPQERIQVLRSKQTSYHHIAMGLHLLFQTNRVKIICSHLAEWLHGFGPYLHHLLG